MLCSSALHLRLSQCCSFSGEASHVGKSIVFPENLHVSLFLTIDCSLFLGIANLRLSQKVYVWLKNATFRWDKLSFHQIISVPFGKSQTFLAKAFTCCLGLICIQLKSQNVQSYLRTTFVQAPKTQSLGPTESRKEIGCRPHSRFCPGKTCACRRMSLHTRQKNQSNLFFGVRKEVYRQTHLGTN